MSCKRCKILDDLYTNKILLDALKPFAGRSEQVEVEINEIYVRLETLLKVWDDIIKTEDP